MKEIETGPRKLAPEDAEELLAAVESGPGAPIPRAWARWMAQAEEHQKTAAPDCDCIQCAVNRGEISL